MPYRMLEEMNNRGEEKVAVFLTAQNIFGLVGGVIPAYLLTNGLPLIIRGVVLLAAALLGVGVTLTVSGLTFYERAAWAIRGMIRIRASGAILTPERLSGAVPHHLPDRALALAGPVRPHTQRRHPTMRMASIQAAPRTPATQRTQHPRNHHADSSAQ